MARIFALFLLILIASLAQPLSASAQTITLGGDDELIFRLLRSNGYENPRVTKRGLTIIRTEACRGADKYQIKVSILGKITSTKKVGACDIAPQRVRFDRGAAQAALEQAGYTQIKTEQQGRRIAATACRENRRYQMTFNRRGELADRQDIGRCAAEGLSGTEIVEALRRQGYRRVVVTDDQLPRYIAEACRDNERLRIELNRRGQIRTERRIGNCRNRLDPASISALLEKNGYERIEVIERRRPPYVARACNKANDKIEITIGRFGQLRQENRIGTCLTAINPANLVGVLEKNGYNRVRILRGNRTPYLTEACKQTALVELTVDRYGRVSKEERVGRCASPVTEAELTTKLTEQNYVATTLTRLNDGWRAVTCRDDEKIRIRFNPYGDILRERKIGECPSQSVLQLLKTLESRGAKQTGIYVEGCFKGTKYRWSFDRLGNRTDRARIGGC